MKGGPAKRAKLRLGVFFNPTGHHVASWKHPGAEKDAGINLSHYVEIAQTAERGKMDMIFLQDSVAVRRANIEALSRSAQYIANFEPLTLLSALAMKTDHIGLTATASTSYNEPFHVARKFASLDHISNGRAGWNLVTSVQDAEAQNFGREKHYSHAERYARAREFAEVVKGLWDSWEDDAFLRDVASGIYFDQDKLHTLDHQGEHFSVKGPLNVPRPIQGHPVIVQAGASEAGIELAAEHAEAVFCSPNSIEVARDYYTNLKGRMEKFGRAPEDLKILPGLSPIVASTMSEAEEKLDEMQQMIDPVVLREILGTVLGYIDLSGYDMDGPLPELPELEDSNASKSTVNELTTMAREESLTLRELAMRVAGARGKLVLTGTPSHVADLWKAG